MRHLLVSERRQQMPGKPMRLRLTAQAGGAVTKVLLSGELSKRMNAEERRSLLSLLARASPGGLDVVLCVDAQGSPEWCDGWTDALAAIPARIMVQFAFTGPSPRRAP
jgi:hypothetical protein